MATAARKVVECPVCSQAHGVMACPQVESVEFHADGSVRRLVKRPHQRDVSWQRQRWNEVSCLGGFGLVIDRNVPPGVVAVVPTSGGL